MARRRRIDARCDDGGGLLDERAGLEGDPGERSDVSRAQGFTRGDGAGQHHRALSTLGIFVLMGVGGVFARGVRGFVVVCYRGFGGALGHCSSRSGSRRRWTTRGPGRRGGRRGGSWGKMLVAGGGGQVSRGGSGSAAAWPAGISRAAWAGVELRAEVEVLGGPVAAAWVDCSPCPPPPLR